jgi:hypothetical protein
MSRLPRQTMSLARILRHSRFISRLNLIKQSPTTLRRYSKLSDKQAELARATSELSSVRADVKSLSSVVNAPSWTYTHKPSVKSKIEELVVAESKLEQLKSDNDTLRRVSKQLDGPNLPPGKTNTTVAASNEARERVVIVTGGVPPAECPRSRVNTVYQSTWVNDNNGPPPPLPPRYTRPDDCDQEERASRETYAAGGFVAGVVVGVVGMLAKEWYEDEQVKIVQKKIDDVKRKIEDEKYERARLLQEIVRNSRND